jgi:hypothetical protein
MIYFDILKIQKIIKEVMCNKIVAIKEIIDMCKRPIGKNLFFYDYFILVF